MVDGASVILDRHHLEFEFSVVEALTALQHVVHHLIPLLLILPEVHLGVVLENRGVLAHGRLIMRDTVRVAKESKLGLIFDCDVGKLRGFHLKES